MGALDFLWQGKPPPSTTTYGTTTAANQIPKFMSDYTQGLLSRANAVAAQPYQAYGGPRVAGFTGDQQAAFNMTRQNMGNWQPGMNDATGTLGAATGMDAAGAAMPWFGAAGSVDPFALQQPYMAGASATWGQQPMQQYMSPYINGVVDRIGDLGARNLSEKLMPAINQDFVRAGQYGSSRMMGEVGKALRDTQESVLAQQNEALNQGYGQALSAFNSDASRLAGLATNQGSLGVNYMGQLGNLGQALGNITNTQQANMTNAGAQQGALAQLMQTLGLRDSAALEAIGQQQQALNQQSLDTAYSDFIQQRDYPTQQLAMMNAMIRGLPYGSTSTGSTTSTGPASAYQPSGLSQIAGALSLYGALNGGKLFADGGYVSTAPRSEAARVGRARGVYYSDLDAYDNGDASVERVRRSRDRMWAEEDRAGYARGGKVRGALSMCGAA